MNKNKFKNPKITINKVYTKKGDGGNTQLVGGKSISKSDIRIRAYGNLDELNSIVGMCLEEAKFHEKSDKIDMFIIVLNNIQHQIFNAGNMIATLSENFHATSPQITNKDISDLELLIDKFNEDLPELKSFVLPGGSKLNAWLHLCRTICRRCERKVTRLYNVDNNEYNHIVLRYLNRLSDAFFVWSRWALKIENQDEVTWMPNYKEKK